MFFEKDRYFNKLLRERLTMSASKPISASMGLPHQPGSLEHNRNQHHSTNSHTHSSSTNKPNYHSTIEKKQPLRAANIQGNYMFGGSSGKISVRVNRSKKSSQSHKTSLINKEAFNLSAGNY